ncbi:MAG TPA: CvpA family protein [Pirellulaceae bacterium]|jgi:membrane protein required for colicin V production|nr:CvpA family protein [Pirellulaceae bacterium]
MQVQIYDLIMIVVLAAAALLGFWKGLAWQVASVGSIVLSYFVAYNFRDVVAAKIQAEPPWNTFMAMLLLYLGTMMVVWIGFRFVKGFIEQVKLSEFDRHAGALLGAVKGALICVLITFFALTLMGDTQKKQIATSYSGQAIAQAIDNIPVAVPDEVHGVLQKLRDELVVDAGGIPSSGAPTPNGGLFGGGFFSSSEQPASTVPAPAEQGTLGGLREIFPSTSFPSSNGPAPTNGLRPEGEREANSLLREIEQHLNRR